MKPGSHDVPTNPVAEVEIEVREGHAAGQRHVLRRFPAVVGRGQEVDVQLDDDPSDPTISRRHLRISLEGGRLLVTDLSTNGTWIGARQLTAGEPVPVNGEESIWLGPRTMLVLRLRGRFAVPAAPDPIGVGETLPLQATEEDVPAVFDGTSVPLRVTALGPFRVTVDGRPVVEEVWQTRKAIVLLAVLAEHYPRLVAADRLEAWLWPESAESARSALQKTASRLRGALRSLAEVPQTVRLEHASYGLSLAYVVDYDVARFEAACNEADQARTAADLGREAAALTKALALYRGDFLERHGDDWVVSRRRVLQTRKYECEEAMGALCLRRASPVEAMRFYEQVLTDNPCRETSQVGLLRAMIAAGRREEATRAYHGFVKTLKSTLDLPPSADLVALYESLHRQT